MDQTNIPRAREALANEGLIVRKPDSGSARQRWARENSKHHRTATRQRGFCRPSLKQAPLDSAKPGMPPENWPLKIVRKAASLRAPTQSAELQKFRVCRSFCQSRGRQCMRLHPTVRIRGWNMNVPRGDHKKCLFPAVRKRVNFISPSNPQGTPTQQEKGHVSPKRSGDFEQPSLAELPPCQP